MPVFIPVSGHTQVLDCISTQPAITDERWFVLGKGVTVECWDAIVGVMKHGDAIQIGPDIPVAFIEENVGKIPALCGLRCDAGRSTGDFESIVKNLPRQSYIALPKNVFFDSSVIRLIPPEVGLVIPQYARYDEFSSKLFSLFLDRHLYIAVYSCTSLDILNACEKFKGSKRVFPSLQESQNQIIHELKPHATVGATDGYFLHNQRPLQASSCSLKHSVFKLHRETPVESIADIIGSLPINSRVCLPPLMCDIAAIEAVVNASLERGVFIQCSMQEPVQAETIAITMSNVVREDIPAQRSTDPRKPDQSVEEPVKYVPSRLRCRLRFAFNGGPSTGSINDPLPAYSASTTNGASERVIVNDDLPPSPPFTMQ